MSIAKVLTALMERRKLNSNSLANAINAGRAEPIVHQGTIYKIAEGVTKDPGTKAIQPIADYFGITLAQLRGEEPLELGEERATYLPEGKYLFPRSYEHVIAGLGRGYFNDDYHVEIEGTLPIPRDLIAARGWRIERLAVVMTKGPSMYPTINDGEPVVINLDETSLVSSRIYAIEDSDEGLRIKRLYRTPDGRILVSSDNPDKLLFRDEYITPDTRTRIVGRVVFRSGEL